jgi:hypothetical protein
MAAMMMNQMRAWLVIPSEHGTACILMAKTRRCTCTCTHTYMTLESSMHAYMLQCAWAAPASRLHMPCIASTRTKLVGFRGVSTSGAATKSLVSTATHGTLVTVARDKSHTRTCSRHTQVARICTKYLCVFEKLCVFTCICTYIYIYTHTYTHTHTYIYTYIRVYKHKHAPYIHIQNTFQRAKSLPLLPGRLG